VVATDLSGAALELARGRAPEAPVIWVQDDITDTRLRGNFRVALDRGCLHLLTGDAPARHASALAGLVSPGGAVILKTLAEGTNAAGVRPYTADAIRGLFGAAFELEREAASTMPGSAGAPAARLFVLRRRAADRA
jgi:hypothetical protein